MPREKRSSRSPAAPSSAWNSLSVRSRPARAVRQAASTIAAIYKSRWQIEPFFKFLKQNLKQKGFYGTTRNAVLTQIWIASCMALMVAYLEFRSATGLSFQQVLRPLAINLFLRRLIDLLEGKPPEPQRRSDQAAFAL